METQFPNGVSLAFVEALYVDYLRDPESVPPDWRHYFQSLSEGNGFSKGQSLTPAFRPWSIFKYNSAMYCWDAFRSRESFVRHPPVQRPDLTAVIKKKRKS